MSNLSRRLDKVQEQVAPSDKPAELQPLLVPLTPSDVVDGKWREDAVPPTVTVGGRDFCMKDGKAYRGPPISFLKPDFSGSDAGTFAGGQDHAQGATQHDAG